MIGERLRLARHHHTPPLTADALCALIYEQCGLEISQSVLSKIEGGLRSAYDYEVVAFTTVLDVSSDWLLGLSDEKQRARKSAELNSGSNG